MSGKMDPNPTSNSQLQSPTENDERGTDLDHDDDEDEALETSSDANGNDGHLPAPFQHKSLYELQDNLSGHRPSGKPIPLYDCMQAAVNAHQYRFPVDAEAIRRLIRDILLPSVDACLQDPDCVGNYPGPAYLYHALVNTAHVAANKLIVRLHVTSQQDWSELDYELCQLMNTLAICMDEKPVTRRLDDMIKDPSSQQHMSPQQACIADTCKVIQSQDAEGNVQVEEVCLLQCALLNKFGTHGGLDNVIQVLENPTHALWVQEKMLGFLLKAKPFLKPEVISKVQQAVCVFLENMAGWMVEQPDRLSHGGVDRNFHSVNNTLSTCYLLVLGAGTLEESHEQVAKVQRKFVETMLASTSFNKQFSAARECHALLERAAHVDTFIDGNAALQAAVQWMAEQDIIKLMLRSNLHQRQYMEQVRDILNILTKHQMLHEEHVQLLWDITEKEDTFEGVKVNVYQILGDISASFSHQQMDMLFSKFQAAKSRPVPDTLLLLELCRRLAFSDKQAGHLTERLLNFVWDEVCPSAAPPELVASGALEHVLRDYWLGGHDCLPQYLDRCMACLQQHINVYPSLVLLRSIINVYPSQTQGDQPSRQDVVAELFSKGKLVPMLVQNLQTLMARARAQLLCAPDAQLPEQGCYSYQQLVEQYMQTIQFLHEVHNPTMAPELCLLLWEQLVEQPVTSQDKACGLRFFLAGISRHNEQFISPSTAGQLLREKIMALDPATLQTDAYSCFFEYFRLVNLEERKLELVTLGSSGPFEVPCSLDIVGLEFLWATLVHAVDQTVASQAAHCLKHIYEHGSSAQVRLQLRTAFCQQMVQCLKTQCQHLLDPQALPAAAAAVPGHAAPPPLLLPSAADQQPVAAVRCMTLLKTMMAATAGSIIPPVPPHRASWRGNSMCFEVNAFNSGSSSSKFRISTHTNAYVGNVRKRIAEHMHCPAKRVRLLHSGTEWRNDSIVIADLNISKRATINATVTPIDLPSVSDHMADTRQQWRKTTVTGILAEMREMYDLLFTLADSAPAADVRQPALDLLQQLPTRSNILEELREAVSGPSPYKSLKQVLQPEGEAPITPFLLLYTLQALCALLFPAVPEPEPEEARAQAAAAAAAAAGADGAQSMTISPKLPDASPSDMEAQGPATAAGGSVAPADSPAPESTPMPMPMDTPPAAGDAAMEQEQQLSGPAAPPSSPAVLPTAADAATPEAGAATAAAAAAAASAAATAAEVMQDAAPGAARQEQQQQQQQQPKEVTMAEASPEPAASKPAPTQAWLEAFVSSGCIHLVFDAVQHSLLTPGKDLAFYRELANLMVLMLSSILHFHASGASSSQDLSETAQPAAQGRVDAAESSPAQAATSREPGEAPEPAAEPPAAAEAAGAEEGEAAQQADSASRRASNATDAMSVDLGGDLLKDCVSMLMVLCLRACSFWSLPQAVRAVSSNPELAIIKDILVLLSRLHETFPDTVELLQAHPSAAELINALLLNRDKEIRILGNKALCKLYVHDEVEPTAHEWLLALLVELLPRAKEASVRGEEFFELMQDVVKSMPEPLLHSEYTLGEELLHTEISWLHVKAQATDADVDMTVLEGTVKVVKALVQALDKRSVGCEGSPSLIQLLLEYYLFPEALQPRDMENAVVAASTLDRLVRRCDWASSRKQVYELLTDLMVDSPANYREGLKSLQRLHLQHTDLHGHRLGQQDTSRIALLPELRPPPPSYVGLKNAGATCYMNSVLQQLFMQPRIRQLVLSAKEVDEEQKKDSLFHQLQVVFAQLMLSHTAFVVPRSFWFAFKDYDGQPIDLRDHQDAYEFFTRLQDSIDQHLKSSGQTPAIQAVMGGKFAQQIICKGIDYTSEREEEFYQISVDVRGKGSLEKSLASYVQGELMEGENAYFCEEVGKRVAAVRRSCIKELPHTLVIHLKRFDYDHYTLQRSKVRDRFEFPPALDMFRYTAEGLAAMESGEAAQAGTMPRSQYMYELKGIVVHAGSAFAGHYYSYIKERPKQLPDGTMVPGSWWCFDDKVVRPWDISNLEADCYGGKASEDSTSSHKQFRGHDLDRAHSAYMLFYERHTVEAGAVSSPQRAASGAANMDVSPGPAPAGQVPMELGTPYVAVLTAAAPPAAAPPAPAAESSGGMVGPVQPQTPYNMPYTIFEAVVRSNMDIRYRHRLYDRQYFRFMRQLIEVKWDAKTQNKKARRGTRTLPAGGQVGTSGEDGSPTAAALEVGRASHRSDELRRVTRDTLELGLDFVYKVWFRAPRDLKQVADLTEIQYTLETLINSAPVAAQAMLYRYSQDGAEHTLQMLLCDYGFTQAMDTFADLLSSAMLQAAHSSNLLRAVAERKEELDSTAGFLHHVVMRLVECLHNCAREREPRVDEPRVEYLANVLSHYALYNPLAVKHILEHADNPEGPIVELLELLLQEMDTDNDSDSTADEVYALLRLCYVLLSRCNNIPALLHEQVSGFNPRLARHANCHIKCDDLPQQMWDKLSRSRKVFNTLLNSNGSEHHKEMLLLMRLLMWNNVDALGPSVLAMQRAVWFKVVGELEALEATLLQLCAHDIDGYTDARLRLLVEGMAPGLPLPRSQERDLLRHCLLEQIKECHRTNKEWHVLFRLRHLARLAALGGPVGETVEQVLYENLMKDGEFADEWRSLVRWVYNIVRGVTPLAQELQALAVEASQVITVVYNKRHQAQQGQEEEEQEDEEEGQQGDGQ